MRAATGLREEMPRRVAVVGGSRMATGSAGAKTRGWDRVPILG